MKVKEVLKELAAKGVDANAIVAFDFSIEWFAKKEIQTCEYQANGKTLHGVLLREKNLPPHIKDFSGVLTVGRLTAFLKQADPDMELLVLADGYVRRDPEPVSLVKVYERVFKGQVKKTIVRFTQTNWKENVMKELTARRRFKVTYNEYEGKFVPGQGMDSRFVHVELIGYADNLQDAIYIVQSNLEVPADLGRPRRVRDLYNFDITECYGIC